MKLTVHIAETIRSIVKDIPKSLVIEKQQPITIRQLTANIGIPPVLVVFTSIDGVKKDLDAVVSADAQIHLFGTMAGG